jgi:CheY-like chemotaxis protein
VAPNRHVKDVIEFARIHRLKRPEQKPQPLDRKVRAKSNILVRAFKDTGRHSIYTSGCQSGWLLLAASVPAIDALNPKARGPTMNVLSNDCRRARQQGGGDASFGASAGRWHVVVVDSDEDVRREVIISLNRNGLDRVHGCTRKDLDSSFLVETRILVLDIDDGKDGFSLLRRIRSESRVFIIVTSARLTHERDRVRGLELGADDFINKPYSPLEVVARVRALMRRSVRPPPLDTRLKRGSFIFDGWRQGPGACWILAAAS